MDRDLTDMEDDHRSIVNLLIDQIEFANVILLNKSDLVSKEHLGILKSALHKLNPSARIIESSYSKIDVSEILNTGLFNFEQAEQSAGWLEELNKEDHTPETEEYGISSFVYRSRKPFNPKRLWNYIKNQFPKNVIRSKGLFWMASRPKQALIWSQAGGSSATDSAGVWWSSMSFEKRTQNQSFIENKEEIETGWDPNFGDRKNELVFIGQDMDQNLITQKLNNCLCTQEELDNGDWEKGFEDEWPVQKAYVLD